MAEFREIWRGLDWSVLSGFVLSIVPSLICIVTHELCHGLAAYALGDMTAKQAGRLTLNPIRHIDFIGLLMMAVFRFGWAKPVPVDMRNFKHPKRDMALVALAGPVSNLLLALLFVALYIGLGPTVMRNLSPELAGAIVDTVLITAYISIALGVFNMLPIPPLDGSKVLFAMALSDDKYYALMEYERYGMILIMILFWTGLAQPYFSYVTEQAFDWVWTAMLTIFSRLGA